MLFRSRKKRPPAEFDPFAGGYPVPPLPGQTLPPSARRSRPVEQPPAPASAALLAASPPVEEEESRG